MPCSQGNLLEAYLAELARSARAPATVRGYGKDLKAFFGFLLELGVEDPLSVLPEDLLEYRRRLLQSLRPPSVNRRLAAVKGFYRFLSARGLISSDPARELAGVPDGRKELAPRALGPAERRALLREARRSGNPLHRAVVIFLLYTGLRASELCALSLKDLELSPRRGRVLVRGKGEKVRSVPLSAEAREVLTAWLEVRPAHPSERVFIGRRGPLTPAGVWRIVSSVARRAGLERVHPHVLRHTFATRLLREAGADLPVVAALLGHERLDTTARYTRPSDRDLEAAVERL